MRNTKWIYKTENYQSENGTIDKDIAHILYNRGIDSEDEIDLFINGSLERLGNPSLFSDVDKAVERLLQAREKKQSVWIYGDYDVDGITSTSLCYLALREIGIEAKYYIPLRDEGYGLNKEALSFIKSEGGDLVISVDCGISSVAEVEHCNSIGLEIIITDHHEINQELPPAYAIINPKREDNKNSFKYLAGVGTAFMLLLALYKKLDKKIDIYKYLDIVAIGTIADIVPLKGDNRILVKRGLELLRSSKWLGLNMLLKRIYENPMEKKFDTYDVGFIIAPIFNAAGRLEDAKMAVELFINESHVECDRLISELINKNSERKEIQERILERATNKIEEERLDENLVLVVAEEGFHHGVIGIVASKILDKFYKPTIVMEIKSNEGIATASCRSIENFNMIEALNSMRELFVKYGGHAGAAGFSIEIDKIEEFSKRINSYAKEKMQEEDLEKPIKIDCELSLIKISYDLMDKLGKLEPYGFGNPSPLFVIKNCKYDNFRAIGKEKNHLMMNLKKNDIELKNCVWFNSDDMMKDILEMKEIDVAFKLKMETYKDKYQYKIFIEDIKPPKNILNNYQENESLKNIRFPLKSVFYTRQRVEREKLGIEIYENEAVILRGRSQIGFLDEQTKKILIKLHRNYNYKFKAKVLKIEEKEENFNVFIEIERDLDFITTAINDGKLFTDIKNFLLGDLEYNSLQKKVLGNIFRKNLKTSVVAEKGRGIKTIIKTIGLYYNSIGKKVFVVGKNLENSFVDFGEKFTEGYDYYIFIDEFGEREEEVERYNLIFSSKEKEFAGFEKIIDDFEIPKNVKIVEKEKVEEYEEIFYHSLPIKEKKKIIEKIKNGEQVFSTREIKIIV